VVAAAMLGAAGAAAAIRYASPTGHGAQPCADINDPCDIGTAIQGGGIGGVQNGDTVLLLPGTYLVPDASPVSVGNAITVGAAGPTRPTVTNSGAGVFLVSNGGATLQDLDIVATNLPSGLSGAQSRALDLLSGSTGERLYVAGSGASTPIAVQLRDGATLRDSVAWSAGTAGVGVITGGTGGQLRNVTSVGPSDGDGVFVSGTFGPGQTAVLRNVIATAGTDVRVTNGASGTVTLVADHSNYDALVSAGDPDTTQQTAIQIAPPVFVDAPTGNFHQASTSPTIDAGSEDSLEPGLGTLDLDGDPRVFGAAPDIGADEFVPASEPGPSGPEADTTPPDTTITGHPKDKTKKKTASFEFTSSEPGSTFECKLDDGSFEPCSSPKEYKVKKGKHTFAVRAKDGAGNLDPTPATDSWKVKKRRKK